MKFNDYINKRLEDNPNLAKDFWSGYDKFKVGVLLKETRLKAGYTQEEVAKRIHTTKSAISRIENHVEDIRLSTLDKFAQAIGKTLHIGIS